MASRPIRFVLIFADLLAVPLALFLAWLLRYGGNGVLLLASPGNWSALSVVFLGAIIPWMGLYLPMSLDSFNEGRPMAAMATRVGLGAAIQMVVILAIAYLSRVYFSRLWIVYFGVIFCGMVLLSRIVAYSLLCNFRRAGKARRTVIIGDGKVARELVHRIQRHPELPYEVVGYLNPGGRPGLGGNGSAGIGKGGLSSLEVLDYLTKNNVRELIVCLDRPPVAEIQQFLTRCLGRGTRVCLVPQAYELYSARVRLVDLEGVPLVALQGLPDYREIALIKRVADLVFGLPLLVIALPILAVSSVALKLQGKRFWQTELRGGKDGKPFLMYRLDVDRHAPNAHAFQQILSNLSISELPQLINVILGHMSLVGPRPESLDHVRNYSPWQRRRLNFKPGITGLAQVNGLRDQHSSEEKTRHDLQYMVRWTPIVDVVLLFQTVWTLGARLWTRTESATRKPPEDRPTVAVVSRRPATL